MHKISGLDYTDVNDETALGSETLLNKRFLSITHLRQIATFGKII